MTDPYAHRDAEQTGNFAAEADAALDHALRERPVGGEDVDFDDQDDAAGYEPQSGGTDAAASEPAQNDYVLYSDVLPHLQELMALRQEREKLIDLLLYARDRVSSAAVAARMDDGMGLLGIQVYRPSPGDPFDAAHHEASATVYTDDPAQHGHIAEVELAGYTDGDRVVRAPVVTVFTNDRKAG